MSNIETLNLIPRGDVTRGLNFGTNVVEFENGIQQVQRKWVSPRISFSFTTQGDKEMKKYLEDFVLARGGNYEPFYWEYDGTTYVVRFGSTVEFKEIRGYEGEGVVGYEASIELSVCKESEY